MWTASVGCDPGSICGPGTQSRPSPGTVPAGCLLHPLQRASPSSGAPSLSGRAPETSVLEAGHVVTVEPGIYLAGKYGCRIEDMIAINEDGSIRDFTKSPKELIEL